jgi:arsenate reductase-like glutaredoxin family protein
MEIKTSDGALTLEYDGEMLSEGLAIFVKTNDGNLPAPDGQHMLEGGITITTKDGKIETILETAMAEQTPMLEEKMEATPEEVVTEVADVVEEVISEEVIKAVTEAVSDVVEEMMKKMEEKMKKHDEKMTALESKFSTFSAAPAAEKTIVGHPSTRTEFSKSLNQDLVDKFIKIKNQKTNN